MLGLVKFLPKIKLNSKECPPNLNVHRIIPTGQSVLPKAEATERQKPLATMVT